LSELLRDCARDADGRAAIAVDAKPEQSRQPSESNLQMNRYVLVPGHAANNAFG
jgi:hypothetical protein